MLLVEGPSDRDSLPVLVRKITPDSPVPKALPIGKGDMFNPRKVKTHIGLARSRDGAISKVLVCVDSECTDIDETRERLTPLEREAQRGFRRLIVRYIVVDHSVEGWLLCDRVALRNVLGGAAWLPRYGNPEINCRPAELLSRIFRRNRPEFIKTRDVPRLAREADVKRIAKTSGTFRDFQQILRDP